jgi:ABC-type Fe3+/spermidine/putrescine transport system ATPase subunit
VDGLSLALHAGELVALVGASGSGKTTALRLAAGYDLPDAGQVLRDGEDITRLPPERRGFGVVFQHHALFPHLSVGDNVAFGLEARGVRAADRRERARRALDAVGLDGTADRRVQALSGGEQQRVALARALVIEPRVLLLDEPLSSLDPALRIAMRDELRALLHGRRVTALLVTHDQEDAFAVADRVALLRHGRLLQVGTPEALYDRPVSAEVAAFIGRGVLVPATLGAGHAADLQATIAIGGVAQRVRAACVPEAAGLGGARRAMAVLRPEQLALVDAEAADAWRGRVTSRRFAGAATVYHVALGSDTVVQVASADRDVREGDAVGVRLVAAEVAVVPADDASAADLASAHGPAAAPRMSTVAPAGRRPVAASPRRT